MTIFRQTKAAVLLLAAASVFVAAGCSAKKQQDTPPSVGMTSAQLQQNIDQINKDATLSPQEKALKVQMLKTHMAVVSAGSKP